MRYTTVWAAAVAALMAWGTARADGPVPPVMVGSVVIVGSEAEEMIDILAHHYRRHYHHGGDSLDWLAPSVMVPTPERGMPLVVVGQTYVAGREAEEMISKLSRMRHHGRYHAGDTLDWLQPGLVPVPMPVAAVAVVPVAPPPMPVMPVMAVAPVAPVVMMVPPPPMPLPAPPPPKVAKEAVPDLSRTIISLTAQGSPDYAAVGLGLTVEGRRWGFNLNGAATVYHVTDSDTRQTNFKIFDGHLVFAPITGERGRVRMELGVAMATGGGAYMFAPDVGLSGDIKILGPFGLLGSAHAAFWPYTRYDVFGGAFVKLWVLRVEGGWRYMELNASAQKDGQVYRACDNWNGPYLGVSLVF